MTTKLIREQIVELLNGGKTPKEIFQELDCDLSYVYLVRSKMTDYVPKVVLRSKETTHTYEGVEGLKLLLEEYDKACKTIDKVVDFLLTENADLKEQVSQFNKLVRDARRPVFSPRVSNALVVHGD